MRRGIYSRALLCILAAVTARSLCGGVHPETGLYRFQHFEARDLGAGVSPQNWSIAQDARGVMYFGNTDGVLEYDGLNWRVIPVGGGALVRAVAVDSRTGVVYVGAQGDIGYLKPDRRGELRYVSVKEKLPQADRDFVDVWRVFTGPGGVYFSTVKWLARLDTGGNVKTWHGTDKLGKAFLASGAVYVRNANDTLLKLSNDSLVPVPGGAAVAKIDVVGAVDMAAGSLVATAESVYLLDGNGLRPLETGAENYFSASAIYTLAQFPGGGIAAGTKTGGLVLLDAAGRLDRVISKAEGLPSDYVTAIASDRQGGVWLTHFNGITRFNPGLTRFTESQGLMGETFCITRAAGTIYAGTGTGLFRMISTANAVPRFEQVAGIDKSVFVLLPFGGGLLAGTSTGVFEVNGSVAAKAVETTATVYDIAPSRRFPDRVYAAGNDGVAVLRREGARWSRIATSATAGQVMRTVAEDADGRVWASSRDRIWRIDFNAVTPKEQSFTVSEKASVAWQNTYRFRDRVVFATQRGLMNFSEQAQKLVPDSLIGGQFADGSRDVYYVVDDANGDAWITGKNYHGILHAGKEWRPMPLLETGITMLFGMQADKDGTVWAFGDDYKLFRWSPSLAGNPNRDFHVLTRGIAPLGAGETLYGGAGGVPRIGLPYRDNALRFQFAAPFFENNAAVEYQYELDGSGLGWSQWSRESKADYRNISEGDYRFRVRARNPHGVVTEDSVSVIAIAAPWYRTWLAYALYAICGSLFVWGVVRLRVRQLEQDKRQLEATVVERTVEIRQQRDEIQVQERKSHSLLLNILPAQVADELKSTGAVKPVGFDDVTVCFTDFVGFTLSSEKMPPAHLVDALNEYFTAFDEIIARYGLEKLKTIGDSYMFVSGLPERRTSHAVDAVLAAIEMVDVVKRLAVKVGGTGWNIRVGLHSGPVVAGVVGTRKFAFDIWGNTVNFAARMESSGVHGAVNMSERTCRLTRGLIDCEGRGNIRIKEGRELPMFLAKGVAEDFARRYREEFGVSPRAIPAESRTEAAQAVGTAVY